MSVRGSYVANLGPVASTCCAHLSLGDDTTGSDGVAVLKAPPFTFRPVEITASRPGWPPRTISLRPLGAEHERDAWGRVVIFLGPPRDLAGRIEMGTDCPPGFVEVTGGPPNVRVPVDADGRFVLRGLSPDTVSVGFSACGRNAGVTVERGAEGPLVLLLPAALDGKWPVAARAAPLSAGASPSPAPPAGSLSCLLPGAELVGAGDFDSLALDPLCRFVLAGKRTLENRHEAAIWTLLRPDGTAVPIGTSVRGTPALGESTVLLSVPGDEITLELVDFVRGTRERVLPPSSFSPAAQDTVVLVRQVVAESGSQAQALEVRYRDGTRRKLPGPVSGWALLKERTVLAYGVLHGKGVDQDVHLLDLGKRTDRLVLRNATGMYPAGDGRTLLISTTHRTTIYDVELGTRDVLPGSRWEWSFLGPDLALRTEKDGHFTLRRSKETMPLGFGLPRGASVHRLSDRALLFEDEGDAVVLDTTTGAGFALAHGVRISDRKPVVWGDRVALVESSGRVVVASLSGGPLRAVGRGVPLAFSPDGRWLQIVREVGQELTLASVDGSAEPVTLDGWGGTFAPDAPALFFHTGKGRFDEPRQLFVTDPALRRSVELLPRVLSYQVLRGREVVAAVPPGGRRPAGVYRRAVPSLSP